VLERLRSSTGEGGCASLHPPPRSTPEIVERGEKSESGKKVRRVMRGREEEGDRRKPSLSTHTLFFLLTSLYTIATT